MIQPKIQEVYLPTKDYTEFTVKVDFGFDVVVDKKELITFTPEEFEQFKREFGKELLEKAADNATSTKLFKHTRTVGYRNLKDEDDNIIGKPVPIKEYFYDVNKQSITEVLDDYLLNNKI
jgi:hypothetical protein